MIGFAGLSFQYLNSEDASVQISLNERSEQIENENEDVSIAQIQNRSLSNQAENEVTNKENYKSTLNKISNGSNEEVNRLTEVSNNRLKTRNTVMNEAIPPTQIDGSTTEKAATEPEILTYASLKLESERADAAEKEAKAKNEKWTVMLTHVMFSFTKRGGLVLPKVVR